MKKILVKAVSILVLLNLGSLNKLKAQTQNLSSPDGRIQIEVSMDEQINWSLRFDEQVLIKNIGISMTMNDERSLGLKPKIKAVSREFKEDLIEPQIPHKNAKILSRYNELDLDFDGKYSIIFRAYDDGVAYRFIDHSKNSLQVKYEELSLDFPEGSASYFPKEESMYSHNERLYIHQGLEEFKPGDFCSLPVLFDSNHAKVLITEAALLDYPGMFLQFQANQRLGALHPKYVLKAVANQNDSPDRNQILEEEAPYIAKVGGARAYPWRVFMVAKEDKTFIESNLLTELSEPS